LTTPLMSIISVQRFCKTLPLTDSRHVVQLFRPDLRLSGNPS
jgi:hypothetical protein